MVVPNNTTVNEDTDGHCFFCGEFHIGKPCPDSETYTKFQDADSEDDTAYSVWE